MDKVVILAVCERVSGVYLIFDRICPDCSIFTATIGCQFHCMLERLREISCLSSGYEGKLVMFC